MDVHQVAQLSEALHEIGSDSNKTRPGQHRDMLEALSVFGQPKRPGPAHVDGCALRIACVNEELNLLIILNLLFQLPESDISELPQIMTRDSNDGNARQRTLND